MKIIRNTLIATSLLLTVASPFVAAADSKNKNKLEREQAKIEKKIEKQIEKQNKEMEKFERKMNELGNRSENKCLRAWGHLVAFGWIKKNGNVTVDLDNCSFPFGIGKKLGSRATSTDTTAPVISNIASYTGVNKALLVWNTDEKTTGKVYYSTSSPVNLTTAPTVNGVKGLEGKSHFAALSGLASSTTYYFIVEAKDKAGNLSRSNQSSFTTKTSSTTADTIAPTISLISSQVGTSTINVTWQTNEAATSRIYYATSTPINTTSSTFIHSGSLVTNHNLKIENLSTSTLYYLMLESVDSSANVSTSTTFSVTTAP